MVVIRKPFTIRNEEAQQSILINSSKVSVETYLPQNKKTLFK